MIVRYPSLEDYRREHPLVYKPGGPMGPTLTAEEYERWKQLRDEESKA